MSDFSNKLRLIRRFTGSAFSAAKGYDARKPLSRRRQKTIDKYYDAVLNLTYGSTQLYHPKRGEKKEAFAYTGQTHFPRFNVAIVKKTNPEAKLKFKFDKSRPKRSRFFVIDKRNGQRQYHIPAEVFTSFTEYDEETGEVYSEDVEDNEFDPDFYSAILEQYAEDADFFLIQNGETHLWNQGGGRTQIIDKLIKIKRNYDANKFDPNDRNSSYWGNWFTGVTAFTSRFEAFPAILKSENERRSYRLRTRRRSPDMDNLQINYEIKKRRMRSGKIGKFLRGDYIGEED